MKLHELVAVNKKNRKRIGRGTGSGHGKTSCRGHKGQKARSGGNISAAFEGGQMPLYRKLPKRGFTNIFRKEYDTINIRDLEKFDANSVVDQEALKAAGLIGKHNCFKVLGNGEITKVLTVQAHMFSKGAQEKIEKAGGKVEIL